MPPPEAPARRIYFNLRNRILYGGAAWLLFTGALALSITVERYIAASASLILYANLFFLGLALMLTCFGAFAVVLGDIIVDKYGSDADHHKRGRSQDLTVFFMIGVFLITMVLIFLEPMSLVKQLAQAKDGITPAVTKTCDNGTAYFEADVNYFVLAGEWYVDWDNYEATTVSDRDYFIAPILNTIGCTVVDAEGEPTILYAGCTGTTYQETVDCFSLNETRMAHSSNINRVSASSSLSADEKDRFKGLGHDALFQFASDSLEEVNWWIADVDKRVSWMYLSALVYWCAYSFVGLLFFFRFCSTATTVVDVHDVFAMHRDENKDKTKGRHRSASRVINSESGDANNVDDEMAEERRPVLPRSVHSPYAGHGAVVADVSMVMNLVQNVTLWVWVTSATAAVSILIYKASYNVSQQAVLNAWFALGVICGAPVFFYFCGQAHRTVCCVFTSPKNRSVESRGWLVLFLAFCASILVIVASCLPPMQSSRELHMAQDGIWGEQTHIAPCVNGSLLLDMGNTYFTLSAPYYADWRQMRAKTIGDWDVYAAPILTPLGDPCMQGMFAVCVGKTWAEANVCYTNSGRDSLGERTETTVRRIQSSQIEDRLRTEFSVFANQSVLFEVNSPTLHQEQASVHSKEHGLTEMWTTLIIVWCAATLPFVLCFTACVGKRGGSSVRRVTVRES